jgi:hypothetical protein
MPLLFELPEPFEHLILLQSYDALCCSVHYFREQKSSDGNNAFCNPVVAKDAFNTEQIRSSGRRHQSPVMAINSGERCLW